MDDNRLIQNLKTLPLYSAAMEKLTVAPSQLDKNERTFLLTVAIILLRKYERDHRLTSFVELAYFIILKYSLLIIPHRGSTPVAIQSTLTALESI